MPIIQSDLDQLSITGVTPTDANRIVDFSELKDNGNSQMRAVYDNAINFEAWLASNAPNNPLRVDAQRIAWYVYDRRLTEYEWPEPPFARPA